MKTLKLYTSDGRALTDLQSADGPLLRGRAGSSLLESRSSGWFFWPCDQHGNKTRRGA